MLFDCRYRIPWTRVYFGLDPIFGLVPIVGDLIMAAASMRLIMIARSLGASRPITARMILNVLLDLLLGVVPFAGPVMDLFYRANLRNLDLLLREVASGRLQLAVR